MKKSLKAVLLGGAASLACLTGANAADLPQAEPVEYVKVCETYGAGFFYIPGTDTCIRVGGYVRFQIYSHTDNAADDTWDGDPFFLNGSNNDVQNDTYSMYTRGLVNFDARTETSYGTLRSFIQIRGTAVDQDSATVELDKGFLQFAGFTAGLAPSFLTIENPVDYFGTHNADFAEDTILLGYTAELGNGFSASVALESAEEANDDGTQFLLGENDAFDFGDNGRLDTRQEFPAVVANLRVKQSWGSAMIGGAVSESKTAINTDDADVARVEESDLGWAVTGGLTINVPALAEGDAVTVKAAYSDGLSFYTLGSGGFVPANFTWDSEGTGEVDNLSTEKVKVFTAYAGLVHNWTSTIRSNIGVNYADIDFGYGAEASGVSATANVIWSPVKNLDVGLELIYSTVDANGGGTEILGLGDPGDDTNEDGFGAIFRIQRNFGS